MSEAEFQHVQISGSGVTTRGVASLAQAGISVNLLDKELLTDLGAGNEDAFWCLWTRHEAALRQVCFREMDGHRADAEDALSQVMLKVQDRLPACASEIVHLEGWLRQLARNLCIDLRRQSQRRTAAAENWENDPLAKVNSSRRHRWRRNRKSTNGLPPCRRRCGSRSNFTWSWKFPPKKWPQNLG